MPYPTQPSPHLLFTAIAALALSCVLLPGCATVHVWANDDADTAHGICSTCRSTEWTLAWGLVQNSPVRPDCRHKTMSRVRVKTNLGFALITVATLGIVMPQTVEWDCAPQNVEPDIFGN